MSTDSTPASVLIIGATGYIGGSIVAQLVSTHPGNKYSAIVRNPNDLPKVEALKVEAVEASSKDYVLIQKISSDFDVVINAADADDSDLANAVIAGLEKRAGISAGGQKPIYIHTSGTGVVTDKPSGAWNPETCEKIWNDNNVDDIKSIDAKQPHREVDIAVFHAGDRAIIDTYVVAPSTIYGRGTGPVRRVSQQIPGLIREAIQRKQAVYIAPGTNVWNHVHIRDLARLYQLVFELALSGKNQNKSYANFFWGSVGQHEWKAIVDSLAKLLHKRGLVESDESKGIPLSEAPEALLYTSNNSRTVSERGFNLGWKPREK
ncbi:hypothetical protein FRC03_012693, partial [Tulasnella sp. 419]